MSTIIIIHRPRSSEPEVAELFDEASLEKAIDMIDDLIVARGPLMPDGELAG